MRKADTDATGYTKVRYACPGLRDGQSRMIWSQQEDHRLHILEIIVQYNRQTDGIEFGGGTMKLVSTMNEVVGHLVFVSLLCHYVLILIM